VIASPRTAPAPLKLGTIELRTRVLAAPMCGASKVPYRMLARRYGADIAYTEMVKAYPLVRGRDDRRTLELLQTEAADRPCGPQICGADEAIMAAAAARLEGLGFPLVDINMGCPVPKVVKEGAGSALLKDPAKVESIVRACADAVKVPVTVKIRAGWDGHKFTGVDVARAAEQGGAKLITIHARTREQFHQGAVDFASIAAVKKAVSIPIIGNGSVIDAASALHMLDETGCDGVMVGRGAFGKPWVFREIANAIAGEPAPPPPTLDEVADVIRWHFEATHRCEPRRANGLTRKYVAWYLRDAPWGTFFRDRAFRAKDREEMTALIDEFIAHKRACAELPENTTMPIPAFVAELLKKGHVPKAGTAEDDDEETCEA
jgi:nifR3 family TIM-barrel protein